MRIGLLSTGGTLDSAPSESGLAVGEASGLTDFVKSILHPGQEIVAVDPPWRIDSSQLETGMLPALADALRDATEPDAWIVGCGTDTLAWLAPALWWLLSGLGKPVLVVSGMAPWWAEASDGAANLARCLEHLSHAPAPCVEVVTGRLILPPWHLHKISHLADDPFRVLPLTRPTDGTLRTLLEGLASAGTFPEILPPPPPPPWKREPSVLWLPCHPGMAPGSIRYLVQSLKPRHLVLSGYSGGTVPLSLLDLDRSPIRCHLVSQQWGRLDPAGYAVSSRLADRGWRTWNLAPETVTSLLSLADGCGLEGASSLIALQALETALGR
jgi:L-asparaginase